MDFRDPQVGNQRKWAQRRGDRRRRAVPPDSFPTWRGMMSCGGAAMLLPIPKSMVLCHDVLPGPEGTGNVHLMNVFGAVRPRFDPPFPYRLPRLCVFLQLTDAS